MSGQASSRQSWRDIPLTDPRVERVVDALIRESKSLDNSPRTWRAAQIAVHALNGGAEVDETPNAFMDSLASPDERVAELEGQLKNMTAKWTQRGEEIDTLASEMEIAQHALRGISHREQCADAMPYRDQASMFREVGQMARETLRELT